VNLLNLLNLIYKDDMACTAGGGGRARPQLQSVGGGGISG